MLENSSDHNQVISGFSVKSNIAPIPKRLLAHIIDLGITGIGAYAMFIIGVLLFAFFAAFFGNLFDNLGSQAKKIIGILTIILIILLVLAGLAAYHAYYIYFEYKRGQTPGKKALGLKVTSIDGSRLTLKQCMIRELFKWLDLLYITSLIAIISTDKNQRIGDLAAGTYVTHSNSQEEEQDYIYMTQNDYDVIHQHIIPYDLDLKLRRELLSYAGKRFLYNKNKVENNDEKWSQLFREKIDIEENVKISNEDLLKFIAQYCYLKEKEDGSNS